MLPGTPTDNFLCTDDSVVSEVGELALEAIEDHAVKFGCSRDCLTREVFGQDTRNRRADRTALALELESIDGPIRFEGGMKLAVVSTGRLLQVFRDRGAREPTMVPWPLVVLEDGLVATAE